MMPAPKIDTAAAQVTHSPAKMSTEWNDIVKNVAVLNGAGNRDQSYKDLCSGSLLCHLWSVAESGIAPSKDDIQRLRDLIKEYEPEHYETTVKPVVKAKYEAEKDRITAEAAALKAAAAAVAETGATDEDDWEEVYNSTDERNGEPREQWGQPGTFYQTYGNGGGEGGHGGYWMREDGDAVWSVAGDKLKFKDGWTLLVRPQDSMRGQVAAVRLVRRVCRSCGLYQSCDTCKKFIRIIR
jgi:hypothetical protein